jgi:membrane protease YdiL (CAAX protease family)
LLYIPRHMPWLWLIILVLYPIVSALPQELIFRVLFVERYRTLFPHPGLLITANALCFGLAHLFYGNWPALLLSALGGAVFAWAYTVRHSFTYAFILHSLAGQIVFTSGLGIFFYHGAVGRL